MSKIVQFPTVPAGARATKQLLTALYKRDLPEAPAKPPREADMVTEDGVVVIAGVEAVAKWRALREFNCWADVGCPGKPMTYSQFYAIEYKSALEAAHLIAAVRRQQIEFRKLPLREQLIQSLELELCRAESGLAMGPVDTDKVARLKQQIAEARAVQQFPTAQS